VLRRNLVVAACLTSLFFAARPAVLDDPIMFGVGPWELLIVLGIALLIFGSRLPSLARSMGKSITEFKKGIKGIEDQSEDKKES
jgi:TatA/E family protein of Tat protein translocase